MIRLLWSGKQTSVLAAKELLLLERKKTLQVINLLLLLLKKWNRWMEAVLSINLNSPKIRQSLTLKIKSSQKQKKLLLQTATCSDLKKRWKSVTSSWLLSLGRVLSALLPDIQVKSRAKTKHPLFKFTLNGATDTAEA